MQIPILIEPIAANSFRARSGEPLPLTAEGTTRDEAVAKLRQLLENKLQNGSEMATIQIGAGPNPWPIGKSIFANDAEYEEFRAILEENRKKADEAEGFVR